MLREILGDRAAVYGVAIRAIQGGAGLVSAVLVLRYFSPEVQGYYYTFGSLLALQIFVELGLSAVINTFAAHEWARLSMDGAGRAHGDPTALARLRSLTRFVLKWYAVGGLLLLLTLAFLGAWFFGAHDTSGSVEWKYPWLAMCLLAGVSFMITPAWALLTGCGQLATLNAYRLVDVVLRSTILWSCIALGASLWSAVLAVGVSIAVGCGFLWIRYRGFFSSLLERNRGGGFDWLKEVAPLQLKIAISWMCGYFIFSLFTPAMFHFHGAVEAGRMGMTWALVAGISGIAGTWLQVQTPNFAMMVSRGEFNRLDHVAGRTALIGVSIFIAGSAVALAGLVFLEGRYPQVAERFNSVGSIAVFLLAEVMLQLSLVQATYLRAFKQEPFLPLSIMGALVVGVGTLSLTPALGAYGPALSYLLGMSAGLAWGTIIFLRLRRQWTVQRSE